VIYSKLDRNKFSLARNFLIDVHKRTHVKIDKDDVRIRDPEDQTSKSDQLKDALLM